MRPEVPPSCEDAQPAGFTGGEGAASLLAGEPAFYLAKPAPDLARKIDMSWSAVSAGNGKAFYEILPDGYVHLILRWSGSTCQAFLFGPATEKASVEIDEGFNYFCTRFRPGQALLLTDVHSADLVDSYVELPKIAAAGIASVGDRLYSSSTHTQRQRVVEDLLRNVRPLVRDERCRRAAALVEARGGHISVTELATRLGIARRSLERLFLQHLGMTPKRLIRVVRLQHLLTHLRFGTYQNLTDLAHACGFTDHSHMLRDLRELTGCLPGEIDQCHLRRLAEKPLCRVTHTL